MADTLRAFAAVDVDDHIRQQVACLQEAFRAAAPGAKWVRPELCHVTLQFLGSVAREQLPGVTAACRDAAARSKAFELGFQGIGAFPRWQDARVLWVGLAEGQAQLAALRTRLHGRLAPLGFDAGGRPFSPHMSVARFKQPADGSLQRTAAPWQDRPIGRAMIEELRLIRSDLGREGPVYSLLEAFPLG